MQKFKVTDGASSDGKAINKDSVQRGTELNANFQNDNWFNIFKFIENQGYSLVDDDLSQFIKSIAKGTPLWQSDIIYNSGDIVRGSSASYIYISMSDDNSDNNPDSDDGTNWQLYDEVTKGVNTVTYKGGYIDGGDSTLIDKNTINIKRLFYYFFGLKTLSEQTLDLSGYDLSRVSYIVVSGGNYKQVFNITSMSIVVAKLICNNGNVEKVIQQRVQYQPFGDIEDININTNITINYSVEDATISDGGKYANITYIPYSISRASVETSANINVWSESNSELLKVSSLVGSTLPNDIVSDSFGDISTINSGEFALYYYFVDEVKNEFHILLSNKIMSSIDDFDSIYRYELKRLSLKGATSELFKRAVFIEAVVLAGGDSYLNAKVLNTNLKVANELDIKQFTLDTKTTLIPSNKSTLTMIESDGSNVRYPFSNLASATTTVGKIELLPFRTGDLPFGWFTCNGGGYSRGTAEYDVLNSLPNNYKEDWSINPNTVIKIGEGNTTIPTGSNPTYLQNLHIEGQINTILNGEYRYFSTMSLTGNSPTYDTYSTGVAGYVKDNGDGTFTYILNYNPDVSGGDDTKFYISTIIPDDSRWESPLSSWFEVSSEEIYYDGGTTYIDTHINISDIFYLDGLNLGTSDYYYGYNNTTLLQLPNYNALDKDVTIQGNTSDDIGLISYIQDQIQNITGFFRASPRYASNGGVFYRADYTGKVTIFSGGGENQYNYQFDASQVVRTGEETKGATINMTIAIYLGV